MAHTPGPWTIQAIRDRHIWIRAGEVVIAEIDGSNDPDDDRVEADAHLIASAPELLELVNFVLACEGNDYAVDDQWIARAEAAIEQAEGRQS
jgi:hypothetical protein